MSNSFLESAPVAKFCDDVAVAVILDNFESFEDVRVGDSHGSNLLHAEEVLGDLIVDGFEIDDFDGNLRLVGYIFGWIGGGVPK